MFCKEYKYWTNQNTRIRAYFSPLLFVVPVWSHNTSKKWTTLTCLLINPEIFLFTLAGFQYNGLIVIVVKWLGLSCWQSYNLQLYYEAFIFVEGNAGSSLFSSAKSHLKNRPEYFRQLYCHSNLAGLRYPDFSKGRSLISVSNKGIYGHKYFPCLQVKRFRRCIHPSNSYMYHLDCCWVPRVSANDKSPACMFHSIP